MFKKCFTPGEAAAPRWLCIRVGRAVEWVVRQEYCFDRGGCDEYQLGGAGVDFFDENFAGSGTTRCRFLSGYLVSHHPMLDEGFISNSCEVQKKPVDPGDDENERFAIPDIITDLPGIRTEFYEVKPNSVTGRDSGRQMISTFLSLVDFLKHADPTIENLAKGTQFSPDRSITIYSKAYLGIVPVEVKIHYFRLEAGLIVYEICVTAQTELLEALVKAIIITALIALAVLIWRSLPEGGIEAPSGGAPILAEAVGPDGVNNSTDVRYVQALLNDFHGGIGGPVIEISGEFNDETIGSLSSFQSNVGLDDTGGSVSPGDETIVVLQASHLANFLDAVDVSELELVDTASFIAQEDFELVDTEGGDELVTQFAIDEAATQYLQLLHDNV
ncbi:MAG: hypothetical protein WCZ29_19590 [Mycolicibacterium vanbaalenii]|uniref:peptidoglycan-binding domain-containing protein n=1 Tax=Mycolicibacterium vanbaalenii TaxID=110539 RepID=UPI003568D477